jgi:hypothetical protein
VNYSPVVKIETKEITDYAWSNLHDQSYRENNLGVREFIKMKYKIRKIIIGRNFDILQLSQPEKRQWKKKEPIIIGKRLTR